VLGLLFFGAQNGFLTKIFSGSPIAEVVMPEGIILFYGEGCPHCKVVDDFITENKIEDKVKFSTDFGESGGDMWNKGRHCGSAIFI